MNNYSSIHTNIFTNCLPPSSQGWGMQLYTKWYTSKVKEVNKLRNTAPTPLSDTTYYSMDINITGSDTLFYTTTILHIMASLSSPSIHAQKKKKKCQLILIKLQWPYALGCNQLWQRQKDSPPVVTAWVCCSHYNLYKNKKSHQTGN